jgi:transcriptional regulator with XRE-family HTH domain
MRQTPFQEVLRREFQARRAKNPRYSLRAFAALLGTDHSTLSQVMRGTRRPPIRQIHGWARKLGMTPEEATVHVAAQHLPDAATAERQEQLRHWTAEAMGVVTERAHWEILRLSHAAGFKPDCRWIAEQTSTTVDEVNVALSRLLRLRLLKITGAGKWTDTTGLRRPNERDFRKLALVRVREEAAKAHIKLRGLRGLAEAKEHTPAHKEK